MPFRRLYYHVVWATKGRVPVLKPALEPHVRQLVDGRVRTLGGKLYALGVAGDHMHLAVSIPPHVSVSRFVGEVKGAASFHASGLPDAGHELEWQRGFGVVTFRRDNMGQVVEYIQRQKELHASGRTWPSLEDCGEDGEAESGMVCEDSAEYEGGW